MWIVWVLIAVYTSGDQELAHPYASLAECKEIGEKQLPALKRQGGFIMARCEAQVFEEN